MMEKRQRKSACQITSVGREVIESRLLVALTEEDKVAVVLTESDLDLLIRYIAMEDLETEECMKLDEFAGDLKQLRKAAFGR